MTVAVVTICDACGERPPYHASSCQLIAQAPLLLPDSAAFAGLAGDVVRAIQPYTEADPVAILITVLTEFGAMVGSNAETRAGSASHPPAIYAALVGRTSRSRKGTSERETSAVFKHVEDG